MKVLCEASAQAWHHFTRFDQVDHRTDPSQSTPASVLLSVIFEQTRTEA